MLGIFVMILGMIILASTDAISKYLTISFAVIQILWVRYMVFAAIGSCVVYRKYGFSGLRKKAYGPNYEGPITYGHQLSGRFHT